jgi:nicotinate-nucleotide adenylyltransferase
MRLGIIGGTFDPIHLGHVQIARLAFSEAVLDRVLFLPDGAPPHKIPEASDVQRLNMVQLAIEGMSDFLVSDLELKRFGITYTIDTLLQLKEMYPDSDLFFIIGADTLFQFKTWKMAHLVAKLCQILLAPRQSISLQDIKTQQLLLQQEYGLKTQLLSQAGPDISSSLIRQLIRQGKSIDGMVPSSVKEYIQQQSLYI